MYTVESVKQPKIIEKTIDPEENAPMVTSRIILKALFTLILFFFTFELLTKQQPYIMLDYANLFIHETGHFVFFWLGRFMNILGGSLLQVLVPFFMVFYFLLRKHYFSSLFGLFWLGESLVNVSLYIADARAQQLPLVNFVGIYQDTKEGHDWYNLLTMMNILNLDTAISQIIFGIGVFCVICSLIFCLWNIFQETQTLSKFSKFSAPLPPRPPKP